MNVHWIVSFLQSSQTAAHSIRRPNPREMKTENEQRYDTTQSRPAHPDPEPLWPDLRLSGLPEASWF